MNKDSKRLDFPEMAENIARKRLKRWLAAFYPFPTIFSKGC